MYTSASILTCWILHLRRVSASISSCNVRIFSDIVMSNPAPCVGFRILRTFSNYEIDLIFLNPFVTLSPLGPDPTVSLQFCGITHLSYHNFFMAPERGSLIAISMALPLAGPCRLLLACPSLLLVVADTSETAATGTAEVGGWTTRELFSILDGLEGLRVIGADVVEVAPVYDNPGETTVLAAAEIVRSLLTLMVQKPVKG